MGRQTSKEPLLQQQQQHAVVTDDGENKQRYEKEDFLHQVEQLLRERVRDEQLQRKQDVDKGTAENMIDEMQEAAATSFSSQQESKSKSFWLTHCRGRSAADAFVALECLHVVRECVLQPTAAASSSCAGQLSVYLYALLQCICREAATAKNSGVPKKSQGDAVAAANAACRITGGMALLWVLVLQQFSPEDLHKNVHSDGKLLMLLLDAINACSISEQAAIEATGCSPRPLLLLLSSLQHCFSFQRQHLTKDTSDHSSIHITSTSPSSDSTNKSSSNSNAIAGSLNVCNCFPARGVWQRLLHLLTEDARASVRHRARQTAQSLLFLAATEAAGPADSAVTARGASAAGSWKRQQHARASVMACVSELQKYMSSCQACAGDLILHHEEPVWQKTRFLRVLPLLRRVLASLLRLPFTGGFSGRQRSSGSSSTRRDEKVDDSSSHEIKGSSRHGAVDCMQLTRHMEERAQQAHQMMLLAVRDLCMQTAFLNPHMESFTAEAAQGVCCVVDAVADALQQQQQSQGEEELGKAYCREGGDFSFVPGLDKLLLLPVAAQLLSGLLQQGTHPSSRTRGNSSSGRSGGLWQAASAAGAVASRHSEKGNSTSAALGEAAAPVSGAAGAAEYAAAWCGAVSTALAVLTQWTGLPGAEEIFPYREAGGSSSKALRSKFSLARQQMSTACGESGNGSKSESEAVASPEDETRETELLLEQLQRLTLLPHVEEGKASEKILLSMGAAGTAVVMVQGALSAAARANACAAGAAADGTRGAAESGVAEGDGAVADLSAGQQSYARRADLCCRVWRRVLKCLCEGLAVVRDSSVTSAIAAAGRRLVEQATRLELPLLDAAVPYCLALLHYKQKQQWHDALQQAAQLFRSLELVALKQFSRGSPCFPQLQRLASMTVHQQQHHHKQQQHHHKHQQHHHKQQSGQEQQQGNLSDYMDAYADVYREAFEPLLERIVSMLSIVETGALPDNSSNRRSRVMQINSVHSSRRTDDAEESCGLSLASLQQRDMAVYRGDLRSCFAAALHAFTCRVLLSKSLLPLIFFMEVEDLSQTDLVVFDERAAAAQAAESCRISSSGRSHSMEWCSNSWLLPLLPGCLKRDRLGLFAVYFFPLAQQLQQQARHAFTQGQPLQARELCRLQQQVWGLLPGFCCQPLDLARALRSEEGSKLFDFMLQLLHEPVLRQDICASIANLCAAVAVPLCAAAAAAPLAGVEDVAALKAATASTFSTEADPVAAHAVEASKRRAAALVAVLRSAVQKGCSSSSVDDEVATALAAVAGSGCCEGRGLLQLRAAPVMGFLVLRYLQLHKLPAVGPGGSAAAGAQGTAVPATSQQQRSFLAAMLLGEKESLENLTQSAKMKAAQHLLRAIKAYAPLCPKELLHANVRRFTSAFLNRATAAAAALGAAVFSASADKTKTAAQSSPARTAVLGPTETAALVDITDALFPVLSEEFTVEVIGVLRDLLEICVGGLKKQPQTNLTSPAAADKGQTACSAVEVLVHRQVLQMLLRRAYKTLKHVLERSLERMQQFSLQQQQLRQQQLHQQQLHQQQLQQQQRLPPEQRLAGSGKQPSTLLQEERVSTAGDVPCNFSGALPQREGMQLLSSQLLVDLWKVLEPGRAISWIASAEKARLGCLRLFVCYCLSAQAHAEKAACNDIEGSSRELTQGPTAVATTQENAAAEWGMLLEKALLPVLVPEILLCLKTPNRVVRDTALDTLSAVAEACEDDREKLSSLVLRIAAGLGGCFEGEPPLMKAAAALALSRIIFSFSEEMGKDLVTEVADVVLMMLEDDNAPAFLGALHFAKVLVHVLDAEQLEPFLPTILNLFESKAVTRARMKIRRLLEKLLKKLGDSSVEAAFPKKHLPLLRHLQRRIRKQQLRSLLCNAALQEGLSWEELDFGMNSSSKKEDMPQPAGKSVKHSGNKHARQRFADVLEEEEKGEDDEESEEEEEETARDSSSQKSSQKKGISKPGGKRKVLQGGTAADKEKEESAAAGDTKPGGAVSVYLREMLDAADGEDPDEQTGGKKWARHRAGTGPISLAEDQAGDSPLDLLSPAAAERVLLSRYTRKRRRQETLHIDGSTSREAAARETHARKEEEVYWNEEGRLVVVDTERNTRQIEKSGAFAKTSDAKKQTFARMRRLGGDSAGEKVTENKRPTLSCLAARRAAAKAARQQKRGGHFVQQGGEAFKSKKARGDVMKNKKIEPFAYIRLNPAMIREKYRPKALKSLSTVFAKPSRRGNISAASRGVQKGRQRRNRRGKKL